MGLGTLKGVDGLKSMAGKEWGTSHWLEVKQDRIDAFADATGDHQWIHVDPERANAGLFGATIAHGFLTLSLIPTLSDGMVRVEGVRMGINYGLNKVRFPSPVRVGSGVRAVSKNVSVEEVEGGVQVVNQITIEIEGQEKPACVAEMVSRYYF
jgi:acyl dehydratase